MDLNRDELRRELRAIDADNKAAMPKWYDALRQIVGGGTNMSTDEKAALLGVPSPGRRSFFKLGGATIIGAAVFELVRHLAKEEAPLKALTVNNVIISTIAEITFYGHDQTGREVSVTGRMSVDFGNFGDPS